MNTQPFEQPVLIKNKPKNYQLTMKQLLFVQHYIDLKNARQAAIKAGYSIKTANCIAGQLLDNPLVIAKLDEYKREIQKRIIVTFEEKARLLWDIAVQSLTPQYNIDGKLIKNSEPSVAIKAIEVLNTMQGHNAPTQSVQINANTTIDKLKQCAIEYQDH
jgi:phage terminase small subunit